ncbi:MAG: PilW family protein [Nevskiales bacterium]|nr:PilW family protein [Nevskiales bacterium]
MKPIRLSIGSGAQRGLSLVELLISITLGLILLAGITQIFVSSKQGYRVQQSNSELQENGRYAMEYIGQAIRHADFWGGVEASTLLVRGTVDGPAGATTCTSGWLTDVTKGIYGYDGGSTPPIDCIDSSDYAPNTDILVSRYVDPSRHDSSPTDGLIPDREISNGKDGLVEKGFNYLFVRTLTGQFGIVYNLNGSGSNNWDAVGGDNGTLKAAGIDDEGYFNHRYRTSLLYIRKCSVTVSGQCPTSSDGIPTLVSAEIKNSGKNLPILSEDPLVENVEQMQILYGVDQDGNLSVDRYYTATDMPASAWQQVIMARVGILVRGSALDSFQDTETYTLPGGYSYTPAGLDQRYPRRLIIKDFQIRNRTRG